MDKFSLAFGGVVDVIFGALAAFLAFYLVPIPVSLSTALLVAAFITTVWFFLDLRKPAETVLVNAVASFSGAIVGAAFTALIR
jgi:hypothetical protein